jgi:hypothetical protein
VALMDFVSQLGNATMLHIVKFYVERQVDWALAQATPRSSPRPTPPPHARRSSLADRAVFYRRRGPRPASGRSRLHRGLGPERTDQACAWRRHRLTSGDRRLFVVRLHAGGYRPPARAPRVPSPDAAEPAGEAAY